MLMGQNVIALDLGILAENEGLLRTTKKLANLVKFPEAEFHALLEVLL